MVEERAWRPWLLLACAAAAPLPAQDDLAQAVAALAVPEQQERACWQLLQSPRAAVPLLRDLLQLVADVPGAQAVAALYVLGRLRGNAAAALPEVHHAYAFGGPDVRRQAIWAMGQIAPATGDALICKRSLEWLRFQRTQDLDGFLFGVVEQRLLLGPHPQPAELLRRLGWDVTDAVAVAEAVVQDASLRDPDVVARLEAIFREAVERPAFPWDASPRYEAAAGDLAMALLEMGRRDTGVARGLLQHWDRVRRREGLLQLADASSLTVPERLDVFRCLWDGDRSVRELALATLQGWGAKALVALPSLRAFGVQRADDPFASACDRAAEQIVRNALADATPAARALLRDADDLLRGRQHPGTAALPADGQAAARFAELVIGSRADLLGELAKFARSRGCLRLPVVDAFLFALGAPDPEARHAALRALAALGPVVASVHADLDVLLTRAYPSDLRVVLPAEARIRAGPAATGAELAAAVAGDRWHVALRAMVEAIQRGAIDRDLAVAAGRVSVRTWPTVTIHPGESWAAGLGWGWIEAEADTPALRAVTALVLAAAGDAPWDEADLRAATAETFAIQEHEVAAFLQQARAEERLAELAARVETDVARRRYWPAW